MPCTATAPMGSSIPIRSTQSTPTTAIEPATAPITTAAHGATNPDARAEQERACERGERPLVVDDGRTGEVLHAEGEEPAAGVPDPVRDDRVEDGEEGSEDEVDPQLRPLRHRAPDDRQRHAGEND